MRNTQYDAFLLVSFGGPEGIADVMPFLENVLRGKNVPRERMLSVAKHYELFDGVSPINAHNRQLIAALKPVIELAGPRLPIYWGNRNWHPLLADTIKQMTEDGVKRVIAFATAGYSSYSSCRQYLENIESAMVSSNSTFLQIDKIRPFYNHPGFIRANMDELLQAYTDIPLERRQEARIIFTAHSIPLSMAKGCLYERQLQEVGRRIMSMAQLSNSWQIAFQSRSGSPSLPWLEPDINEVIEKMAQNKARDVLIAPIGFVSDHMEIVYDLDTQVKQLCEKLHIGYYRAKTAGTHPEFISMIRELVDEKLVEEKQNDFIGSGVKQEFCSSTCCPIS